MSTPGTGDGRAWPPNPAHTAIVTQELQTGIIGDTVGLRALADEARREALPNIARLLPVARAAGISVAHCLVQRRSDGRGSNHNAKLFALGASSVSLEPGRAGTRLLPEFGPESTDLTLTRIHGLGPMGGTDLDAILRNLGVQTIIPVGVSLNVAIPNLVMDAVNKAYRVILPRDAVAGVPHAYGEAMIDHTLSLLAQVTTTDDLIDAFTR